MIRKISANDAKMLAAIHEKCFSDHWKVSSFNQLLSQNVFFGFAACDSGKNEIFGFILGKIVCKEVEIITFCVLEEFRRQGIGKSLLNALIHYSQKKSASEIFLEVPEDNIAAISLYKSFGYEEISRRGNYYRENHQSNNALVMFKNMDCPIKIEN
jgi:ribosomal-protein-alanine N-acetyltransferase